MEPTLKGGPQLCCEGGSVTYTQYDDQVGRRR
ncbi:hypothetical protein A2U01_0100851, partial [Trifolium medium]|nr:hypothetical protein [Trifolium medium]